MTTNPANPRRFSRGYSEFSKSETDSETNALSTLNYYGVKAERGLVLLRNEDLQCRNCGYSNHVVILRDHTKSIDPRFTFLDPSVRTNNIGIDRLCTECGHQSLLPKQFIIDLTFSRGLKIIGEVYGEKTSLKGNNEKIPWLREHDFTLITIPNKMANEPAHMQALAQSIAKMVGSGKPDNLWEMEI